MSGPARSFAATFAPVFVLPWRHRDLVWQMTKRDVLSRYRGSVLGLLWSFFNPLLMLLVYTFVFSAVFQVRWQTEIPEGRADFAIVLFAGMLVHQLFGECVNRSAGLIVGQPSYVKRVVFPLEILPWTAVLSALFHVAVSLAALLFLYAITHGGSVPVTALWLPAVLFPFAVLVLGLSWFVSSLGVYLRDVGNVVSLLTVVLMFLCPIFYPIQRVPESVRPLLYLNPLTLIVEQTRAVLLWGQAPSLWLVPYLGVAMLVARGGLAWFERTKKGFADVL